MAITLTHTASNTTLTLPDALNWVDEYAWSPVVQAKTYTTTGALLIEEATKQAGRPVSLEGSEDKTWCTRAMVDTLRGWAATAGMVLTLTLRGVARQVVFDHERGALQGIPVFFYADAAVEADDFYVPTLRFVQL
jgi:hypothetical protein